MFVLSATMATPSMKPLAIPAQCVVWPGRGALLLVAARKVRFEGNVAVCIGFVT